MKEPEKYKQWKKSWNEDLIKVFYPESKESVERFRQIAIEAIKEYKYNRDEFYNRRKEWKEMRDYLTYLDNLKDKAK
tara:strand:- start:764 stop:994 length:231 start_codon:yes stop_codon:yes gene_type:complete